ncbi:MAG: polymerase protein [candidate division Kazan bacterium GW2011_GWC1_52_13]|uniref:Polymerase protein n=1 Tax=candidate division Kazan bacterium GW2011_GWB1_52_7 TaxID=1620414 RepID=A0A0G1X6I7_UNCK3|nr:MAG: polymerase protein [candidate division Kazan bacterium GW2011_GWC1_52_13]KKW26450.1 MAG: polymerase protein [candidate division Kazan bacterium GW2011_GWB1_52_7]
MKRLVLIDTQNFFHRAFYAFPLTLTTSSGEPINAVYGFASMLFNLAKELKPTHIAAAYESLEEPVFRQIDFPEYKGTRVPKSPEEQAAFEAQLPKLGEFLAAAGVAVLSAEGYEADDVMGTVAHTVISDKEEAKKGVEVVIASNDRDLMQLINGGVRFYLPAVGKQKTKFYGKKEFEEEYGFAPQNLVDYKSLRGDPSDNIPGVRGIGDKTARELIAKYGTLEEVYHHLLEVKPAVAEKLSADKEKAELSYKLAKIVDSAPLEFKMGDLQFGGLAQEAVLDLFKAWGFKSLTTKIFGEKVLEENQKEEDKSQLKLF